ncbi:hypothetical protein [Anatilimnocola floriformis]|uniref:hypothetical protein n=1 Tax=Anatilimnocola floriformis TaxID=2948575 RepID=UPI0020C349FB|nr:hypothetical protein [Anatilimnocola floriformis]
MNATYFRTSAWLLISLLAVNVASAGSGYVISSGEGEDEVTYKVNFGGGRRFEQYTAFDPASKKFVYLKFNRGEAGPAPASSIFNPATGEMTPLYKFPDVEQPLPIIKNIEELKAVPFAKKPGIKTKLVVAYD